MDIISELPDDLLLRIMSLLHTKTAFDSQLLSKRWRNLWKKLPTLYHDYTFHKSESQFLVFINKTLELLESPVLESLYIRIVPTQTSSGVFLRGCLLAKLQVRELNFISIINPVALQIKKEIYHLQTLVILRIECCSLEDGYGNQIIPLQCLKVLHLRCVKYSSDASLSNLLSSLPSLEDLFLDRCSSDNKPTKTLSIAVPRLLRLTVLRCPDNCETHLMRLNVNAPSLKYLNVEDHWRNVSFSEDKMEELIEADVNVGYIDTEKLLKAFVSVKRLSLCVVTSKILRVNVFFNQLVRLEICTCQQEWWNVLEKVLLSSPKLCILKLHQKHLFGTRDPTVRWKEPSSVPVCFASHLETFEWRGYEGTEDEKKLASYILRNAGRLKTVTIYPLISNPDIRRRKILKNHMSNELVKLSGRSFTCKLVFR
ncbi:BnaA02g08500D [Brassica napus]|uniref:(rape) hypothetical protein n=1 Tax=Brassica napus TaxID=3708 RepID=A0A078G2H0_BRANA|nr:unnamed protein product [Brassica napus]CDY20710.1 BnaA02g08500D [Brassica napus]